MAPQLAVFIAAGYAVAQSGYAAGGWAIQEAVVDTESLRRYFVRKYGPVKETYVTGHSMGGFLTMMLMETQPSTYDAGLPLCGPLAPANALHRARRVRRACDVRLLLSRRAAGSVEGSAQLREHAGASGEGSGGVGCRSGQGGDPAAAGRVQDQQGSCGHTHLYHLRNEGTAGAGWRQSLRQPQHDLCWNARRQCGQRRGEALRGRSEGSHVLRTYYTPTGRLRSQCSQCTPVTIRWFLPGCRTCIPQYRSRRGRLEISCRST